MNPNQEILTTELSVFGKCISGILILTFLAIPVLTIIAYWPNIIPKDESMPVYNHELFNVCLLNEHCNCVGMEAGTESKAEIARPRAGCSNVIYLNTLLIILVASGGFMGSMIHVSSSLVSYIGANKLKKSWLLWYFVTPFTGACLSIVFYFIVRAGFLGFGEASHVNIYGILTLAVLSGLFADKATLKLEEIFSVLFKPKDERPDKLKGNEQPEEEGSIEYSMEKEKSL